MPGRALVLAAGLGTRLRPFSDRLPKPAWPFFDLPIAAHALAALAQAGVTEAVVNTHHLPAELRAALEPALPLGMSAQWSFEPEILGTGGALLPWTELLDQGPFWLVNGDTYRSFSLSPMAAFHQERGAVATLCLAPAAPGCRAPIEVDETGRIVGFLGAKAPGSQTPVAAYDFAGVHLLEPEILAAAQDVGRASFCINAEVHKALVAAGRPLYGYIPSEVSLGAPGVWSDLGTPKRYLGLHREMLLAGALPPAAPGRLVTADETTPQGGRVVAPSFLGVGATVEAGAIAGPLAVLGGGSVVQSGSEVREAVVWPGTRVKGNVQRAVVASWGEAMNEDGAVFSIGTV